MAAAEAEGAGSTTKSKRWERERSTGGGHGGQWKTFTPQLHDEAFGDDGRTNNEKDTPYPIGRVGGVPSF